MSNPSFPALATPSDERRSFDRDGYLILEQALNAVEIEALREAADRAEERWMADPSRGGSDEPYLRRVEPLLEYGDEFLDLLDHPSYFPILLEVLGNGLAILDTAYFVTPPGQGWGSTSDWHIDEALTGLRGAPIPLMAKVSIPLDDVLDLDDGPTSVLPGSHLRSYEENLPTPDDPRSMKGMVPVLVRAGDILMFHGRIHHAAMPNVGSRPRRVLHYNYGHIWMKPWPGHEPSDRVQRAATTDVRKQLLHVSDHHYQARFQL